MTFPPRTLTDLGWPVLLRHIAERCSSEMAAQVCESLPFLDDAAARERMILVDELVRCLRNDDPPPRLDAFSYPAILSAVISDGTVQSDDLLRLCANLELFVALHHYLHSRRDICPKNNERITSDDVLVASLQRLSLEIRSTFEPDGTIRDTASPALQSLRKRTFSVRQNLISQLETIARDNDDILRDGTITIRNDRYVLPVRTDAHRPLSGILHGSSATGATAFMEPEQTVTAGNDLIRARDDVLREEQRILKSLQQAIFHQISAVQFACDALIETEVRIACARLSRDLDAHIPTHGTPGEMTLRNVRHPLLLLDGVAVIPNDIHVTPGRTLLISGPNAGGKTVVLKTVGLLGLMMKAGLPICVDPESIAGIPNRILTDIGDHQSLEDHLSTFAAHMNNIAGILEEAAQGSLVLLDELCSGTDPAEGSALARALLNRFNRMGASTLATTHYETLTQHAGEDQFITNAAVGLDVETHKPTYQLRFGIPGVSSAMATAQRYGIAVSIIDEALFLMPESNRKMHSAVDDLEKETHRLNAERRALEEERNSLGDLQTQLTEELNAIRQKDEARAHKETQTLWQAIRHAREIVREAENRLRRKAASPTLIRETRQQINDIATQLESGGRLSPQDTEALPGRPVTDSDIRPGASVYVISTRQQGIVHGPRKGNTVPVQIRHVRMRVSREDLRLLDVTGPASRSGIRTNRPALHALSTDAVRTSDNTLDLRGMTVDEGIAEVDRFLDYALHHELDSVYVLTGYGTGALTAGIRKHLLQSPYVDRFRPGDTEEGGDAVTAVWVR